MISPELATIIASEAFVEPYRQILPMTSHKFRKWLWDREIRFENWQTLHYLWMHGVAQPVGVTKRAIEETPGLDPNRFVPVTTVDEEEIFGDMGTADTELPTLDIGYKDIRKLSDSLWWHPLQLYEFYEIEWTIRRSSSLDTYFRDIDGSYVEHTNRYRSAHREALSTRARSDEHDDFRRILALLLTIEPCVHGYIHGRVGYSIGQSIEDYYDWRAALLTQDQLQRVGLTIDQAVAWHEKLSVRAHLQDPLRGIRLLVSQIDARRREKTEGRVLRANTMYSQAETLRRHLEWANGLELFEEDDYQMREGHQRFKEGAFGNKRVLDGRRDVLRRINRYYGIDHSERVALLLEVPTEVAFFETVAERWGVSLFDHGIVLYSLQGKDRLDRNRILSQLLQKFQSHEVFAYAALDEDGGGDHIRVLNRMAREGVLSAGYSYWKPDFESCNFTLEEIAKAAKMLANESYPNVEFSAAEIGEEMNASGIPVGKAVERLASRRRVRVDKGAAWGRALADVVCAEGKEVPDEIKDEKDDRPAFSMLGMLIRGHDADYDLSVEHTIRQHSV